LRCQVFSSKISKILRLTLYTRSATNCWYPVSIQEEYFTTKAHKGTQRAKFPHFFPPSRAFFAFVVNFFKFSMQSAVSLLLGNIP
jgi:hypothetical protein